jgi:hypothetical protein
MKKEIDTKILRSAICEGLENIDVKSSEELGKFIKSKRIAEIIKDFDEVLEGLTQDPRKFLLEWGIELGFEKGFNCRAEYIEKELAVKSVVNSTRSDIKSEITDYFNEELEEMLRRFVELTTNKANPNEF